MSTFNVFFLLILIVGGLALPVGTGSGRSQNIEPSPSPPTPGEVIKVCKPPVPVCLPEYQLDLNTCRCVPRG
jgi:hypothetical protein